MFEIRQMDYYNIVFNCLIYFVIHPIEFDHLMHLLLDKTRKIII